MVVEGHGSIGDDIHFSSQGGDSNADDDSLTFLDDSLSPNVTFTRAFSSLTPS